MRDRTCDQESAVRAMVRCGRDDPALADHLARCASCRQEAEMTRWMLQLAALPQEPGRLPDPRVLWWKAQLVARWEAHRRAAEPFDAADRVQLGVGLGGCAALVLWLRPHLEAWSARVAAGDLTTWAAAGPTVLTAAVAIAGLVAAATAIVALRHLLAE